MTGLSIMSGAASAGSTAMQYQAQRQQAQAEQYFADYNSGQAASTADSIFRDARENARRSALAEDRYMGALRARTAAGGAVMEGTPEIVERDAAREFDTQVEDLMKRAANDAAAVLRQAEIGQYQARQAASGYRQAATGTLLSGAASLGSIASNWHAYSERQNAYSKLLPGIQTPGL
ncbi:hypothetical protein [Akkermansia glycaniphila]|nr:hypothetical protein [Akkermansia glycaniphila]